VLESLTVAPHSSAFSLIVGGIGEKDPGMQVQDR
jgi:hypothetical protein